MKYTLSLYFIFLCVAAAAQSVTFKSMRSDDDYSDFKYAPDSSWYHRLKFRPLSQDKNSYLSFGGEARVQYFRYKNQDWGESLPDPDGFVLARYLFHGDFHAGKQFRAFVQLQSGLSNGEQGTPSPVNQNPLDLHQLFTDIVLPLPENTDLTLRLGRQELSYGSQRIVSLRDAPNNRQAFDGLKLAYHTPAFKLESFYTSYVQARNGIFYDRTTADIRFWGAYAAGKHAELYYLGIKKRRSIFDEGIDSETRHSLGSRIWDTGDKWQYDLEGLYQFGRFGKSDISAWTLSANVAYNFRSIQLKPQLGLKTEVISGDRTYNDGKLNTFNPLFPRGGYFGLAALIGPSNLFDIHPYVQLTLTKGLTFTGDYDIFWRMNRNDGLYAISGRLLYSGRNTLDKYIGGQLGSTLEYNPTAFLYLRAELTWFRAGGYLKETGPGKNILMSGTTVTFKF